MSRRNYLLIGMLLAGVILIVGCTSVDRGAERRALYVDQHPELSDRLADSILNERIAVGMTTEMVEVSWGPPSRVEQGKGEEFATLWIYGNYFVGGTMTNLYFDAENTLIKYEVQNRNTNANAGTVAGDNELPTGPSSSETGELSKGPGGSPR